jgi:hypothetical protein
MCKKSKVKRTSRQTPPHRDYIDQKQLENVEYFNSLGNLITSDARYRVAIKSRISMEKAEFSRKKIIFVSKLDLNLRKNLVKCQIWSIDFHGA